MTENEFENRGLTLSREWYEKITDGLDLRKECLKLMDGNEDAARIQAAIFLIVYSNYPLALTGQEVWQRLNETHYEQLSDEDFRLLMFGITQSRKN